MLKIFSFFSGSGFLDLGFESAGFTVDLVNEFNPAFLAAYQYSRRELGIPEPQYGYSRDVNEFLGPRSEELTQHIAEQHQEGNLVGFIGGPPCPDFSIAGKQRGRDGDNGKLSKSYTDLIRQQQPDFFLFENVKGLWRTAKHRAFYEEFKKELSRSFFLTERLCNALEFGAPQDRDRILLFGVKKTVARANHLNIKTFDWTAHALYNVDEVKAHTWPGSDVFEEDGVRPMPEGVIPELTVEHWFELNDVEHHPNANHYFQPRGGLPRMMAIEEGDATRKSYKRLHRWRYSPTACYGNNEVHLHPYRPRRISAAEAMAIQTLPREFCLPPDMSLSDMFKTIGNGVPFVLARGIAMSIHDFLPDE